MLRKRGVEPSRKSGIGLGAVLDNTNFADENDSSKTHVEGRKTPTQDRVALRNHNSSSGNNHRSKGGKQTEEILSLSPKDIGTPGDELASTQIVKRALNLLSLDEDGRPSPRAEPPALFRFDSGSILEKGFGAFTNVGKIMEGFAVSLDNVIVQAFEDWGTPKAGSNGNEHNNGEFDSEAVEQETSMPTSNRKQRIESWQDFEDGENEENHTPSHRISARPPLSSAARKDAEQWRKRAQILHRELEKVREQQKEFQRLKDEYMKLKSQLNKNGTDGAGQKTAESEESNMPQLSGLSTSVEEAAMADPVAAQQVMSQMQNLLAEKAKLLQENDRLYRENSGLQELLEFTMMHQVIGDDELFKSDGEDSMGYDSPGQHTDQDTDEYESGSQSELLIAAVGLKFSVSDGKAAI